VKVECGLVLSALAGVASKMLFIRSGHDVHTLLEDLCHHFDTHGAPVMVGGGQLAYCLLGVARVCTTSNSINNFNTGRPAPSLPVAAMAQLNRKADTRPLRVGVGVEALQNEKRSMESAANSTVPPMESNATSQHLPPRFLILDPHYAGQ
jgi:hypothetical protein